MFKKILIILSIIICAYLIFIFIGIPTIISYQCAKPEKSNVVTIDLTNLRPVKFEPKTIEYIKNSALDQSFDTATYQGIDLGSAVSYLSHGYGYAHETDLFFRNTITYKRVPDFTYSVLFSQYDPSKSFVSDCKINDPQCNVTLQERRSDPEGGCLGSWYTGQLRVDMGDGIDLTWHLDDTDKVTTQFTEFANYLSQETHYDYCNPNLDKISGSDTLILNIDYSKIKSESGANEFGATIVGYGNTEDILRLDYYDQNNAHIGGYTFAIPYRTCDTSHSYYFTKELSDMIANQGGYPTQINSIVRQLSKTDIQKINNLGYIPESDIQKFGKVFYQQKSTLREIKDL